MTNLNKDKKSIVIFNNLETDPDLTDFFYVKSNKTEKVTLFSLAMEATTRRKKLKIADCTLAFSLVEDWESCLHLGSGTIYCKGENVEQLRSQKFQCCTQVLRVTPVKGTTIIDEETNDEIISIVTPVLRLNNKIEMGGNSITTIERARISNGLAIC